jgi:hypothetical protein
MYARQVTKREHAREGIREVQPSKDAAAKLAADPDVDPIAAKAIEATLSYRYVVGPGNSGDFVAFSKELALAIGYARTSEDALLNCMISTVREVSTRISKGEDVPSAGTVSPRLDLIRSTMLRLR